MDPFVAREWSLPATGSADVGWDRRPRPHRSRRPPRHQARVPKRLYSQHRRGGMPASLADQAARVAAAHIQDIGPSHLLGLSPRALQVLLKHLDFESMSLSAWKALQQLARAGHLDPRENLALAHFSQRVEQPTADLVLYLAPLASQDFAFISHLRIAGSCLIKAEELLYLPQSSRNLGLLELMEPSDPEAPFPRLSDRLLKAWSLYDEPFPKLKGIRISTHNSVTEQALQYLTHFPALVMLDMTAGKQDWMHSKPLADTLGWIHCNRAKPEQWFEGDDGNGDIVPDVSLTSHADWMRLSRKIDQLEIDSQLGTAQKDFESVGPHGPKTYRLLELPASTMLQQAWTMSDPPGPSALASLTLGPDRNLSSTHRRSSHDRTFFWRYWQDEVRYPLPSESKGYEASQKPPAATKCRDKAGSAVIRSSKKRSAASISDVLSHFGRA